MKFFNIFQSTASDCTLVALLAARSNALKEITDEKEKYAKMGRLVAYTSEQAHSSVERAALLASIKIRLLPTDSEFALKADTFEKAVKEDLENGLEPIFVSLRGFLLLKFCKKLENKFLF